jgi:2-iminobutanoate/2-iminopropanoate deaminase
MEFKKNIVQTDKAPAAIGPYSQGVIFQDICFFSGQIGIDPSTGNIVEGIHLQVNQILKNIDALLNSLKLSRSHILKTTVFLTDLKNFAVVNEAFEKYFERPYPARSTIEVSALPKGAVVEIEVIAALKNVQL